MEMLKLYGFRWEHEIFHKEMKINMRDGDVLHSILRKPPRRR